MNVYAAIQPLPPKEKIKNDFDLIEAKRTNKESFAAFIKDIQKANFNFYKNDSNPPERIKFN